MRIDVLTLFPEAFAGPLDVSILGRARADGLFSVDYTDIREFATDKHRSVDDYPFGGGPGMVMRADVLDAALRHAQGLADVPATVVAMTPQGELLTDRLVRELARESRLILVCGRYEGMDERFLEQRVDREVSIGDFVLTGGELPAMVLIDAVARHIPGVLGDEQSPEDESFADGLLEHPQYTRPAEYAGWRVPDVLLGGNHAAIEAWRAEQRLERTRSRRPDLLERAPLPAGAGAESRSALRVRIREAVFETDIDAIASLWGGYGETDGRGSAATIEELATIDGRLVLVAEGRDGIVGVVAAGCDGYRGHIYELAVAKRFQRRQVGERLLEAIEARLRERGCSAIGLSATPGDWATMRLCDGPGWERLSASVFEKQLG